MAFLGLSFPAFAYKKANIFAYPRQAPETEFYNRHGQKMRFSDFNGDFLLVVFWSKTCIPCLKELDDLSSFVKETKYDGIKVLLISPQNEWTSIQEQKDILKKYGGEDLDFYTDKKSNLANAFGIFTSPHTVLINKDSLEIGRIRGAVDWDDEDVINYIYQIKATN